MRLPDLLSNEFVASLGTCATPRGLRRSLLNNQIVHELRCALSSGEINPRQLRTFVDRILQEFVPGEAFPHEFALAAIAVALETFYIDFSEEYLLDLSRLSSISEFDMSSRVAKLCAAKWFQHRRRTKRLSGTFESLPQFPRVNQYQVVQYLTRRDYRRENSTGRPVLFSECEAYGGT